MVFFLRLTCSDGEVALLAAVAVDAALHAFSARRGCNRETATRLYDARFKEARRRHRTFHALPFRLPGAVYRKVGRRNSTQRPLPWGRRPERKAIPGPALVGARSLPSGPPSKQVDVPSPASAEQVGTPKIAFLPIIRV